MQEWYGPSDVIREVFPGTPELRRGYLYPNSNPGLGIDIDERLAAKFPCDNSKSVPNMWTTARTRDGASARP